MRQAGLYQMRHSTLNESNLNEYRVQACKSYKMVEMCFLEYVLDKNCITLLGAFNL